MMPFVASLKDLAFDLFMRFQPGIIKTFSNLESLFLAQFLTTIWRLLYPPCGKLSSSKISQQRSSLRDLATLPSGVLVA